MSGRREVEVGGRGSTIKNMLNHLFEGPTAGQHFKCLNDWKVLVLTSKKLPFKLSACNLNMHPIHFFHRINDLRSSTFYATLPKYCGCKWKGRLTAFQSVHPNQEFITVVNSCSNTFVWSLATVHQTDYVRMLVDGHCSSIVKHEVKQRQKALFAALLVNCHKRSYSFEFVATIEQSLPCVQIFRVTRAWQRIASR